METIVAHIIRSIFKTETQFLIVMPKRARKTMRGAHLDSWILFALTIVEKTHIDFGVSVNSYNVGPMGYAHRTRAHVYTQPPKRHRTT